MTGLLEKERGAPHKGVSEARPVRIGHHQAKAALELLRDHRDGLQTLSQTELALYRSLVKFHCRRNMFFFAREVLGFTLLTEQTHKAWCDKLQRDVFKFDYIARLKPRKTYKTTIYGETLMLWLWACVSPELHILYTSANNSLLEEVSQHLDNYLSPGNNSLYTFIFGVERLERWDRLKNTWDIFNIKGKDRSSKGNSLAFRTAGGSTNGIHPHIIFVDDPCDKKDRESQATRESKLVWWDTLQPLQHEYNLFKFLSETDRDYLTFLETDGVPIERLESFKLRGLVTTRWHLKDLTAHVLEINENLHPDDQFDFEIESVYKPDGSLQYPEFFTAEKIREIRGHIDSVFWACQYENNPLPEGLVVIDRNLLHYFDYDSLRLEDATIYTFLDPAKGKNGGDFPAVWWVARLHGILYFLEAAHPKGEVRSLAETLQLAARRDRELGAVEFYYEGNGSHLLQEGIERAHEDIGYPIAVKEIISRGNKENRITAMQPALYRGDGQFRKDWETAYPEPFNQLIFFPAYGNDDYPDCAAMAMNKFALGEAKVHVPDRIKQEHQNRASSAVHGSQILQRRHRKLKRLGL